MQEVGRAKNLKGSQRDNLFAASVIFSTPDGWTALHLAAREKRTGVVRHLVFETSRTPTMMEVCLAAIAHWL